MKKVNRIFIFFIIVVIVLIVLVDWLLSINSKHKNNTSNNEEQQINTIENNVDNTYSGSSEQIVDEKNTDSITYEIHNSYNKGLFDYSKRGYYVDTYKMPNSPWFYIITMGEKNSGGYSIEISEVKIDKNNDVEVIVKENSPKSEETVTMALTYPAVCLELNKKPNSIRIINTNEEVFESLNWN